MEATSVFFVVCSGNDVIPTVGESEKCFLWGPFMGYIVTSPAEIDSTEYRVFDSGAAPVSE
jgi:hypothetical protein